MLLLHLEKDKRDSENTPGLARSLMFTLGFFSFDKIVCKFRKSLNNNFRVHTFVTLIILYRVKKTVKVVEDHAFYQKYINGHVFI